MNELTKFLAEANISQPKKGMVGVETDWKLLSKLTLKGGKFLVCDFQFIPSEKDGISVQAPPGIYTVEAKAIDFDGDRRISRLRVLQRGKKPCIGKQLGDTWTDTAMTGICDLEILSKEWTAIGQDKAEEKLQEEYERGEDCGVFTLKSKGTKVPFVSSGFGDGTFPIFELCDSEDRVGFEIEFIFVSTPYPFEPSIPFVPPPPTESEKESARIRETAWSKFGQMIQAAKKDKTGDKQRDRKKLEEAFGSFLQGMQDEALSEIEPLRKHIQQVRRRSLPLTTEYRPMADTSWLSEESVATRISALQEAGFKQIGCFQSTAAPSAWRVAFIHPNGECSVSVIRVSSKTSLHIGYNFVDETEDEFTDNPADVTNFIPPWVRYVSHSNLTTRELILLATQERRSTALELVTEKDYAKEASKSWSRLITWRAETGGLPLVYFVEKFKKTDGPEDAEKVQMMRRDEADKSLCNWLRLQPSLSFNVNDVLDSIVIVHDDLSQSSLAAAWWCGTNDVKVREAEFSGVSPREVFAEINLKRGSKLRLALEKRSGFPADFYLPIES